MPTQSMTRRQLADLLDELEKRARAQSPVNDSPDDWVNRRRSDRRPFRTSCTVACWDVSRQLPQNFEGRTRNLSHLGLSVLVPREYRIDEPVEVSFTLGGSEPLYMSGLVRFCRYAGQGYYEIGMAMKHAGDESIFQVVPVNADAMFNWFKDAIENLQATADYHQSRQSIS